MGVDLSPDLTRDSIALSKRYSAETVQRPFSGIWSGLATATSTIAKVGRDPGSADRHGHHEMVSEYDNEGHVPPQIVRKN
jgi:hypothetical protein